MTSYADGTIVTAHQLLTPDGGAIARPAGTATAGSATSTGKARKTRSCIPRTACASHTAATPACAMRRTRATRRLAPTVSCAPAERRSTAGATERSGSSCSRYLPVASELRSGTAFSIFRRLDARDLRRDATLLGAARACARRERTARPAAWGNPLGFSVDVVVTLMLFIGATIYGLSYIPYFRARAQHRGRRIATTADVHLSPRYGRARDASVFVEVVAVADPRDSDLVLLSRLSASARRCRAAPLAASPKLWRCPIPVTWWLGLASVPFMGWLAWREKNKAYTLLALAYVIQWLPWIASPRISFEYHFFPNLAIILLADTLAVTTASGGWTASARFAWAGREWSWNKLAVSAYLAAASAAFVFWYPVVAGSHISYDAWDARMLTGFEGNNWINPHPGQ